MNHVDLKRGGLLLCFVATCLLLTAGQSHGAAADLYYYYQKGKVPLSVSPDQIAVRLKPGADEAAALGKLKQIDKIEKYSDEQKARGWKLLDVKDVTADEALAAAEAVAATDLADEVSPVFGEKTKRFFLNGQVIVKFNKNIDEATALKIIDAAGATVVRKGASTMPERANRYILKLKKASPTAVLDAANALEVMPEVAYATPDFRTLDSPLLTNDTYYSSQWSLNNTGQNPPGGTTDCDIDAPEAWAITTGNASISIAVIDTGVDMDHTDLNVLSSGYDFVQNDYNPDDVYGHGTNCSGIIAARSNNSAGVAGIAWGLPILPIRIFDDGGYLQSDADAADGIDWAVSNGASILNNSWRLFSQSTDVEDAINNAATYGRNGLGCVVVFAAGNESQEPAEYPSTLKNVISVSATDENDVLEWYSSYGTTVDVAAPSGVYTTEIGGGYVDNVEGTSFSAPHVCGVAALMLSLRSDLSAKQIQAMLQFAGNDLGDAGRDTYYGYGRLNAYTALTYVNGDNFEIKNGSGRTVVSAFGYKHMGIDYDLTKYATSAQLTAQSTDLLVIKNNTPAVVARVDSTGNLFIAGTICERQYALWPDASTAPFILKDASGNPYLYIDASGNLYLFGNIFIGDEYYQGTTKISDGPDRTS